MKPTDPQKTEPKKCAQIRLNKTDVEALSPREKDYFAPVAGHKGLNVRVLPSGKRQFVLRYRFNGIQKKHVLGEYPTMTPDRADKVWHSKWDEINAGKEPNEAKVQAHKKALEDRRAAVTVANLVERYEEEHASGNSESWKAESMRLLRKLALPALGKIPLREVGPAEISSLLHKVGKATPIQANRLRAVLRTMFDRAEEWGLRPLGSNPVAVVKARNQETKRERRLTDLELKALGKALLDSKEGTEVKVGIRMALLAGMRKEEFQAARWEWVDLDAGEIRIPKEFHKTGRKTQKARVIRMCSALVADLQGLTPTLGCPYLIPGRPLRDDAGKINWKPYTAMQNVWERIRDAAGLAPKDEKGEYINEEEIPGLHDLRHTFAASGRTWGSRDLSGNFWAMLSRP